VQALKDRGISFANPGAAIYNGKLVCDDIRLGMTVPQIIAAFRTSNPALGGDANNYVAISVHAYCPQNGNLVSAGPNLHRAFNWLVMSVPLVLPS